MGGVGPVFGVLAQTRCTDRCVAKVIASEKLASSSTASSAPSWIVKCVRSMAIASAGQVCRREVATRQEAGNVMENERCAFVARPPNQPVPSTSATGTSAKR